MELKINEIAIPDQIVWNFEELKTELAEKVREYEITIYSEDQIKEAKADRAALNKLKKALNDERIRREKEYMKPFAEFKAQVAEVISIIDKPVYLIDQQIKTYEERRRQEKEDEIRGFLKTYQIPYGIDPERIFDGSWLNASVSMRNIKLEIQDLINNIMADIKTLEELPEDKDLAISAYVETLNLRTALQRVRDEQDRRAKLEKIRQELEAAAAKAEQEKQEAPKPEPQAEKPSEKQPDPTATVNGRWIEFKAFLTAKQAAELKEFFTSRGILYGPVERGRQ